MNLSRRAVHFSIFILAVLIVVPAIADTSIEKLRIAAQQSGSNIYYIESSPSAPTDEFVESLAKELSPNRFSIQGWGLSSAADLSSIERALRKWMSRHQSGVIVIWAPTLIHEYTLGLLLREIQPHHLPVVMVDYHPPEAIRSANSDKPLITRRDVAYVRLESDCEWMLKRRISEKKDIYP